MSNIAQEDYATKVLKVLSHELTLGYTMKMKLVKTEDKNLGKLEGLSVRVLLGETNTKLTIALLRKSEVNLPESAGYAVMVNGYVYELSEDMQEEAAHVYKTKLLEAWLDAVYLDVQLIEEAYTSI